MLEVKNISKTLGNKQILKDISFSVSSQQTIGIIGPNGAGKSTLFKIMSGLTTPTEGDVLLDGFSIFEFNSAIKNNIGFLIESPYLYDELSGYDNINLCLKLHGTEKNNYIDLICKKLDIEHYLSKKVKKYSQGMKQRLAIACSLVHNPNYLILDEPTNSLDISGIKQIRDFIKFIKDQGKSVIISSHMLNEIEEICDTTIIISNGTVVDINKKTSLHNINNTYIITIPFIEKIPEFIKAETYKLKNDVIEIIIEENNVNMLLKSLLNKNINILNVEKERRSLESHFLKKVGIIND